MRHRIFRLAAVVTMGLSSVAFARGGGGHHSSGGSRVHVSSYTTRNGTHVQSHQRTAPDHSKANNWSTKGNVNPNTGRAGTRNPY